MFFVRLIRNRYVLTVIALVTWLLFFDKNDFFTQYELIEKCRKLEKERDYYLTEIGKNKDALYELRNNKESLERFARETYLMKKDDEDVFVLVTR